MAGRRAIVGEHWQVGWPESKGVKKRRTDHSSNERQLCGTLGASENPMEKPGFSVRDSGKQELDQEKLEGAVQMLTSWTTD